jgi:hypothetical protein
LSYTSEIVELQLSQEQIDIVAPIVRAHVASGRNAFFVATCAPVMNGVWRWQSVGLHRTVAQKLLKIIRENSQESKKSKVKDKENT